jgi:hypothetical protein
VIITETEIFSYLYFGYLPDEEQRFPIQLPDIDSTMNFKGELKNKKINELIDVGIERLDNAFEKSLGENFNNFYIIPVSGGLDSRAILSWLLENFDSNKIKTVTFGTPNTWDYEIGRLVARVAGVHHETIDLTQMNWNTADLVWFAQKLDLLIPIIEGFLFHSIRKVFGHDYIYWNGFMGEALSGSHIFGQKDITWIDTVNRFLEWNRYVKSISITPYNFQAITCLPKNPLVDKKILRYDDQLDFQIRQQCYIRPLVLLKGYHHRIPFIQPEWSDFILNVPVNFRRNQILYKQILQKKDPKLFSIKTKTDFGLSLNDPIYLKKVNKNFLRAHIKARNLLPWINWKPHKLINYIDLDFELRKNKNLKDLFFKNLQDLKSRSIIDWIDIDMIWLRHQNYRANHADALQILVSLELILKSLEFSTNKY